MLINQLKYVEKISVKINKKICIIKFKFCLLKQSQ